MKILNSYNSSTLYKKLEDIRYIPDPQNLQSRNDKNDDSRDDKKVEDAYFTSSTNNFFAYKVLDEKIKVEIRTAVNKDSKEDSASSEKAEEKSKYPGMNLPSPEESGDQIVKFSTGFFDSFKRNHPGMTDDEALQEFEKVIRGAIKTGIVEAMKVIHGLSKDSEETMDRIDKTVDRIEEGLTAFFSTKSANPEKEKDKKEEDRDDTLVLEEIWKKPEN